MAAFRTSVQVGAHSVWVEAENIEDLIKRVSYLTELSREATDDAVFFHRRAGKHDYQGLMRFRKGAEGWEKQELRFGKLTDPPLGEDYKLFAYGRGSDGYEEKGGWRWYNRETEEAEPREK